MMRDPKDDSRVGAFGTNALIQRLETFSSLGALERLALDRLTAVTQWLEPGATIEAEGDAPRFVTPLLDGLAYRYAELRSGRRQIISVIVPGDLCAGYGGFDHPIDYSVRTLSRSRIARIDTSEFRDLVAAYRAIAAALGAAALAEESLLRAWIVNLGQRPARERTAHLLCEMEHRLKSCGRLLAHGGFELPLTQLELGSALGLTSVHVNRVLQSLRADRLIDFHHRVVRIIDRLRLQAEADFNPAYLEPRGAVSSGQDSRGEEDQAPTAFAFAGAAISEADVATA